MATFTGTFARISSPLDPRKTAAHFADEHFLNAIPDRNGDLVFHERVVDDSVGTSRERLHGHFVAADQPSVRNGGSSGLDDVRRGDATAGKNKDRNKKRPFTNERIDP